MGQAHPHAAIGTRRGAGHITQGLCEISPRCSGACLPMRARTTLLRPPLLWGQPNFAPERGAGSRNNAWCSPLDTIIRQCGWGK